MPKKDADTKTYHKMADDSTVKAAIKDAMFDLWAINKALDDPSNAQWGHTFLFAATVIIVGILFYNQPIGRPGEVGRLPHAEIQQIVDGVTKFLTFDNTKIHRPKALVVPIWARHEAILHSFFGSKEKCGNRRQKGRHVLPSNKKIKESSY